MNMLMLLLAVLSEGKFIKGKKDNSSRANQYEVRLREFKIDLFSTHCTLRKFSDMHFLVIGDEF